MGALFQNVFKLLGSFPLFILLFFTINKTVIVCDILCLILCYCVVQILITFFLLCLLAFLLKLNSNRCPEKCQHSTGAKSV